MALSSPTTFPTADEICQPCLTSPLQSLESGISLAPGGIIIHDRQQAYYEAINASNDAGESTAFFEFILSAIRASLIEAISTSDEMIDDKRSKATIRWKKTEEYLKTHHYIMNADVRELCGASAVTANYILSRFVKEGQLSKSVKVGRLGIYVEIKCG